MTCGFAYAWGEIISSTQALVSEEIDDVLIGQELALKVLEGGDAEKAVSFTSLAVTLCNGKKALLEFEASPDEGVKAITSLLGNGSALIVEGSDSWHTTILEACKAISVVEPLPSRSDSK